MPKFHPQSPSWQTLHVHTAMCRCMHTFANKHLLWIFNFDPYLLKLFLKNKIKDFQYFIGPWPWVPQTARTNGVIGGSSKVHIPYIIRQTSSHLHWIFPQQICFPYQHRCTMHRCMKYQFTFFEHTLADRWEEPMVGKKTK